MVEPPNLHDGRLLGVFADDEARNARVWVETEAGEKFTILMAGLKTLVIEDFRQGDIILRHRRESLSN
jgi:hypothetical protein